MTPVVPGEKGQDKPVTLEPLTGSQIVIGPVTTDATGAETFTVRIAPVTEPPGYL
jgi:hypothetical protein